MRILWLNWRDIKNPQAGGAEIMTHETAKRFIRDGHKVTLITSRFPKSSGEEVIDGVHILRKGNQFTCRIWAAIFYFLRFKDKIDLVVDEINTIPFFTNFFVKEKKVVLIHQLAKEYWWHEASFPMNLIGFLLEPLYLRLYKNIPTIVASPSTKNDLEKLGFRKISVFHQGLSVKPLATLPKKANNLNFLFIGRLTKPKGCEDALIAFKEVYSKFKTAQLKVCVRGSKKDLLRLRETIHVLNLRGAVKLLPSITNKQKFELLKRAHFVFIPSLREGWNLVAIEANAYGAVPIGYRVGGLKDSIKHKKTGILTSKNTPYDLAQAAITIISNKSLYQKIAANGLRWSRKYTWEKTYKSFNSILKNFDLASDHIRILAFSWRDPKHPLAGGAEQVMHEHMKYWVKKKNEVTLISPHIARLPKIEILDGVKILRMGYQYLGVQIAGIMHYLKNQNKYDFVIDQFHGLPFLTPIFVKKPKLAVIHETTRHIWFMTNFPWPLNWAIGVVGYLVEPLIFLFYKKTPFVTGSASAKQDLEKFGIPSQNINVIHHGVSTIPPKSSAREKIFTIIYLGILSKDKGIEEALKCFNILQNQGNFQFWIVGRKESRRYYKKLLIMVKKFKLAKKIKFWGFVSQRKKFKLLKRAHVLINPSIKEGWSLVNIEANSVCTPVVAYYYPGLMDSVKNNISGLLCMENTPGNLAQNILELSCNSKRYKNLQKNALSWSKRFSWKKSTKLSLKLVKSIAYEKLS